MDNERSVFSHPLRWFPEFLEFGKRRFYHRQGKVAVGHGAAVAWNVLDDGKDPSRQQAVRGSPPKLDHGPGILSKGAVADDIVGAGDRQVEDGRAGGVEAEFMKIARHKGRA